MCGSVLDLEWNSKSRTWCSLLLEMYQWGLYGAKSLWLFVYYTKLDEWIGIIHTQQPLHETLHILARKLVVDIFINVPFIESWVLMLLMSAPKSQGFHGICSLWQRKSGKNKVANNSFNTVERRKMLQS